VTVAARPSPLARAWSARWPIGAELALFVVLMVTYEWARDLVSVASVAVPLQNADQIIEAQRAMGLFVEPDVQAWTHSLPGGRFVTSWLYTLAHTAGFVVVFLWVWFRRRDYYASFRNWFWTANALAVIGYWLYPLAPPRLTALGLEDPTKTTLELGGALTWFQPFRNEFAAMPSMHVGYTVLFALALFWLLRPAPLRWLVWLWPAVMLFTVMATANHWWLDGVGGAACVLLALALVAPLSNGLPKPWERRGAARA
jgi:membrane-associated phospholipid phosphatase